MLQHNKNSNHMKKGFSSLSIKRVINEGKYIYGVYSILLCFASLAKILVRAKVFVFYFTPDFKTYSQRKLGKRIILKEFAPPDYLVWGHNGDLTFVQSSVDVLIIGEPYEKHFIFKNKHQFIESLCSDFEKKYAYKMNINKPSFHYLIHPNEQLGANFSNITCSRAIPVNVKCVLSYRSQLFEAFKDKGVELVRFGYCKHEFFFQRCESKTSQDIRLKPVNEVDLIEELLR